MLCDRFADASVAYQGFGRELGASAVQELKSSLGIPVISIVQLDDLIDILEESADYAEYLEAVLAYRRKYGVIG